ncbi:unnamed protein product [marine sediment metagenome]|uniref:Uncharacterized protein n=1 Tax=marine sediment metagenome TaxID=412755 RepID=X0VKS9_9ZZZZ
MLRHGRRPTSKGEKLFKFLASLMLDRFYGTVTIRFESGKVTHVEADTRRMWEYNDLPDQMSDDEVRVRPHDLRKSECT